MSMIKQFFQGKRVKQVLATMMVFCLACCMGVAASAEEVTYDAAAITDGVQTVTNSVVTEFNITTIANIIAIALSACIALFLFWWGARKVVRMVTSAFKKGRISL